MRVRFDLHSSINFGDITGSPNLDTEPLLWIAPDNQSGIIRFYWYDFSLVINCTRGHILHRFPDIAFDLSNVAIFGYTSCVQPLKEGFLWDHLSKNMCGS